MDVIAKKVKALMARPVLQTAADQLRREGNVFFVGGHLSPQQAVEAIFESDCRSPVELFVFNFAKAEDFTRAEVLVRSIKRNFKGFLVGQFISQPPPPLLEYAYAAGIDFIDVPFIGDKDQRLAALLFAKTVFPRWAVISTLFAGEQPLSAGRADIDLLLDHDILPLVAIDESAVCYRDSEITQIFEYLASGWRRKKAFIKPLHPLLRLITPLAPPPRKGGVPGLFDKVNGARLRTTSDLRRLLRVREVEESFESAGL
jgi:hypothetical protein